jgi:ribonuclease PH
MGTRHDGRGADDLRPITIVRNYVDVAEGSVLWEQGKTRVLVNASFDDNAPRFLDGTGKGWVTAEYSMLPRSTEVRSPREVNRGRPGGRTQEIQRLIGRSLRAVCDLTKIPDVSLWLDCDVIQADGGTRTASITAAYIALADAIDTLLADGKIEQSPIVEEVAAISVGIVEGVPVLDLDYVEDSGAQVDMNLVMTGSGDFVEVQGTAEGTPFSGDQMSELIDLGRRGIGELVALQRRTLESS